MAGRVATFAFWALLLLPLVLSPLLGLLTPYAALLVIIPLFFVTLFQRQALSAYASYEARAFLLVFVVFAVLFAATADSVSDVLHAFNFTMLLAYGAIAWFLAGRAGVIGAERIVQLAALGVALGFAEVAVRALGHSHRPTGINIGPIVLSNGLLALGFIAGGGLLLRRDARGWFYAIPPVMALATTLLTGSRGPLLAVPLELVTLLAFVWRVRLAGDLRAGLIGLAGVVVVAVAGVWAALNGRAASMLAIFGELASGTAVLDENTRQRLALYAAGRESFLQSPWIGHGWANIMNSVRPFLAPGDATLASLPQLHNDVLNFAVAGGVAGVLMYVVIISTPLIGAWLSPRDGLRTFRLYGAAMLTIVYVGGGLTDLMFGFEFHTFLFAMLTAILLGFCRERPAA